MTFLVIYLFTSLFQNEVIVRRMYPPALYKKGETKTLKRREYVYIMEENLDTKKTPDMEVILAIDIEGLYLTKQF